MEELERQILVLGLDGAGKSSLLSKLSNQESGATPQPTQGFNVMCLHTGKTPIKVWDSEYEVLTTNHCMQQVMLFRRSDEFKFRGGVKFYV